MASVGSAPVRVIGPLAELAHRGTLKLRVVVTSVRLDEELAAGVDPGRRPELALRAAEVVRPRYRRRLAVEIERLIDDYDADRSWWRSAPVPFERDQVGEARAVMVALADALRSARFIQPRGVAATSRLFRHSALPLPLGTARGALRLQAHAALGHLLGRQHVSPDTWSVDSPATRGGSRGDG